MGIRLNKVLSELNIGLQTAVEFLKNKTSLGDIRDDANLTTKINDDQYKALVSEFKGDKDVKSEAEKIFSKKVKEKNEKKVTKAEELLEQRQQFKPVGKIDLESVGKKPSDSSSVARESQPEPKAAAVSPKPEQKPEVKRFIKDIRLFTNTIKQAVDAINSSGLDAKYTVRQDEDKYTITIDIPYEN